MSYRRMHTLVRALDNVPARYCTLTGLSSLRQPGRRMEFVINDGKSDWDKPQGKDNYVVEEPGKRAAAVPACLPLSCVIGDPPAVPVLRLAYWAPGVSLPPQFPEVQAGAASVVLRATAGIVSCPCTPQTTPDRTVLACITPLTRPLSPAGTYRVKNGKLTRLA